MGLWRRRAAIEFQLRARPPGRRKLRSETPEEGRAALIQFFEESGAEVTQQQIEDGRPSIRIGWPEQEG